MNLSKKKLSLILGLILIISVVVIFSNSKLTAFAIKKTDKTITIPNIETGEEEVFLYNKYSNNSGVIVSTPTYISCNWKPDSQDDGWKECEAIFEIDDKTSADKILNSPDIALNFQEDEEIKNIEISYSQYFTVEEETYSSLTKETIQKEAASQKTKGEIESIKSFITAMAIAETEEQDNKEYTKGEIKRELIKRNREEKIIISENLTKSIIKHEDTHFKKRKFIDFSNAPIIENTTPIIISTEIKNEAEEKITSPDTKPDLNISTQNRSKEEPEEIEEESQETKENESENNDAKDFIFKVNVSEPKEEEHNLSIIGNVIKLIKTKEDPHLNTNKPFAIKITFEIPKYSSNNFNFSISDGDFNAGIDPDISACGTLNTENSIYSLTQNVESAGTCFTITADNVTVDCQGYSIRYNSVGAPSYGVYSTATSTKVRNCTILSGDLNNKIGAGIYFSSTNSGEISNNIFTIDDKTQEAILIEDSEDVSISNNELDISNTDSYGVYVSDSDSLSIEDNEITSSSNADAIYTNSSDSTTITNNIFNISGTTSSGISVASSSTPSITDNTILISGASSHGIYLDSSSDGTISENNISASNSTVKGIYLTTSTGSTFTLNNISISGGSSNGIVLISGASENIFSDNTVSTYSSESNTIDISSNSNSNTFEENNIIAAGEASCSVFLDDTSSNVFENNIFQTSSEDGYGIWVYDSTGTSINENTIITSGDASPGLIVDSGSSSDINTNTINTSGADSFGIEVDSFSNSNTFDANNVNTHGESSSGLFILTNTRGNSFSNLNIKISDTSAYSVHNWGSNNSFEIIDSSLNSSTKLLIASGAENGFWNFTNTTVNSNWIESASGVLSIMWYLDAISEYTNGSSISGTNVTAWNTQGQRKFSTLTSGSGSINRQTLTEYTQTNPDSITYYSNYLVNASISGETLSQSVNVSENKEITFTFSVPSPEATPEVVSSRSGSGGGGGGAVICTPDWECGDWGRCTSESQSRVCEDKNDCGIENNKPETERDCNSNGRKWNTKNTLFDINLKILGESNNGLLSGSIGLINIGIPGEVRANLNYKIKNSAEEIIYEEEEVVPVETQIEFIKEINLSTFPDGEYTWTIELSYEGQTEPAQAQDTFTIGKKSLFRNFGTILISLFTILIIVLGAIFIIKKKKDDKISSPQTQQNSIAENPSV